PATEIRFPVLFEITFRKLQGGKTCPLSKSVDVRSALPLKRNERWSERLRSDTPADPPTRHRRTLRHSVDGHATITELGRGFQERSKFHRAEGDLIVDLVTHYPDVLVL